MLDVTIRSIKYKICVDVLRSEKVASLKRGLESQQNVFSKKSADSSCALRTSYTVGQLLAKESKNVFRLGIKQSNMKNFV